MNDILDEITRAIDYYKSGAYITKENLIKVHRTLSCNIYYLTKHNIDAFEKWSEIVFKRAENESVASAEKRANVEVPELRLTRKILEACKNVSIAITNELNILKNE